MNKQPKRKYVASDSDMLEAAKLMHQFYLADKDAFIAFDPLLNESLADEWLLLMEQAEIFTGDSGMRALVRQKKQVTDDVFVRCRNSMKQCQYFAERAFPGDVILKDGFGCGRTAHFRKRPALLQLMKTLDALVVKYAAELLAAGYTQAMADELTALTAELENADIGEQLFIRTRATTTEQRIDLLNRIWKIMSRFSKAGKLIFRDDPTRERRYWLKGKK